MTDRIPEEPARIGRGGSDQAQAPAHDHELEELEDDSTVPPRPEEEIADATRGER
jgi:hypothetical protein